MSFLTQPRTLIILGAAAIALYIAAVGWSHHIYRCPYCGAKHFSPDDLDAHERNCGRLIKRRQDI